MEVTFLTEEEARAFQAVTGEVWRGFEDQIGAEFLARFMEAVRKVSQ
jgi:hypothetical protein